MSLRRIGKIISEEFSGARPRVWAMNAVVRLLPLGMFSRTRAMIYRSFGVAISKGVVCAGPLRLGWYGNVFKNLTISGNCFLNYNFAIDCTGPVAVGGGTTIGHDVAIITSNHDYSAPQYRGGAVQPEGVTIGQGVWVCAHVKILPGVTIGDGSVIAAGAVVNRDIPPNSLAGGVPARVIRSLASSSAQREAVQEQEVEPAGTGAV